MKVYFINVGHGNMSLVKTKNKNILIDCNITDDNDALNQINEVFNNKNIDIFIITHLHKDHMQGINALLDDGFKIQKVYESGFRYSEDNDSAKEDLYKDVVKFLDDHNAEVLEPSTISLKYIGRIFKSCTFLKYSFSYIPSIPYNL